MLIAHLSDLHLGRRSPNRGDPQGAERLNSFRQAIAKVGDESPAAILIAGDVFDSPQVDSAVIQQAARALASVKNKQDEPIPVVVIPGNHDPSDSQRLWNEFRSALDPSAGVHLSLVPGIVTLEEGSLLVEAYPCETRYSAEPPWVRRQELPPKPAGAFHLVMAHGTLQGGPVPEGESDAYPFSEAELQALEADYVALGHFHGVYPSWNGDAEIERGFCYCGTHEPDQFGADSGYALLVTLFREKPTRIRRLRTGKRQWRMVEIQGPLDLQKAESLRVEVEKDAEPTRFVIQFRIPVKTKLSQQEAEKLDSTEASLRALGAQVDRRGEIQTIVDVANLDLDSLPSGALKETLLDLRSNLDQEHDERQREVLQTALQMGWEKFQEVR
jgi:DNA repair exonuclease SbcCD nuclease subunit